MIIYQTCKILTEEGWLEVECRLFGNYAVHKTYKRDKTFSTKKHTVTYVPTGKFVITGLGKNTALQFAKKISKAFPEINDLDEVRKFVLDY